LSKDQIGFMLPFSVAVSAFGFFAILMLAWRGTGFGGTFSWRKPLVGSAFAFVCVFGIILALSPMKCSETLGHRRRMETTVSSLQASTFPGTTRGHHYDCGRFSAHVIRIKGHVFCAACTGLFLGAVGALFGTALYFFTGWESPQIGPLAVLIGVATMALGFLQLKLAGLARSMLNSAFVLGAFLILFGIDESAASLLVDLFSLILISFWLFTRILLSQWDHWRICRACLIPCNVRGIRREDSASSSHSVQGADNY
jgi:hypothetical protein